MTTGASLIRPPDTGRPPTILMSTFDLDPLGYELQEWFVEGQAGSYEPVGELLEDGAWQARPSGTTAPYRTRIIVARPKDAERFDGTAVVEWFNVSGGADAGPDWVFVHNELIRRGSMYVGVSAQAVGVRGGRTIAGTAAAGGLLAADPERYGSLVHPGDACSFDMYCDVGRLVRDGAAGLQPGTVIAIGESQSAFYLVTLVNAIAPLRPVFDGFLIHGRGGGSAALAPDHPTPRAVKIGHDPQAPVLVVQSETDVMNLGSVRCRQPDHDRLRVWEIAGASHADTYTLAGFADTGSLSPEQLARALAPVSSIMGMSTGSAINSGPQQHYVLQAGIDHLMAWARGGRPPPHAQPLELDGPDDLKTDDHGNVLGGVRTPWVDVPTAVLSGLGQSGEGFARLFGRTEPFTADKRAQLYPTREDYLQRFTDSTDEAIAAGFLLDADRDEILALAAATWDMPD